MPFKFRCSFLLFPVQRFVFDSRVMCFLDIFELDAILIVLIVLVISHIEI